MVSPQLLEYVRQQSALGVSKEEIVKALVAQGWQAPDIDATFIALATPQTVSALPNSQTLVQNSTQVASSKSRGGVWATVVVVLLLIGGGGTFAAYHYKLFTLPFMGSSSPVTTGLTNATSTTTDLLQPSSATSSSATSSVKVTKTTSEEDFYKKCAVNVTRDAALSVLIPGKYAPSSSIIEDAPGLVAFQKKENIAQTGKLDELTREYICRVALGNAGQEAAAAIQEDLKQQAATSSVKYSTGISITSVNMALPKITITGSGLDRVDSVTFHAKPASGAGVCDQELLYYGAEKSSTKIVINLTEYSYTEMVNCVNKFKGQKSVYLHGTDGYTSPFIVNNIIINPFK